MSVGVMILIGNPLKQGICHNMHKWATEITAESGMDHVK